MKPNEIEIGKSYLNKSGRSERKVLDIGMHVKARWFGSPSTEPVGEPGIQYIDTRMGKTFYGPKSGKHPHTMYLTAFANWAKSEAEDEDGNA